MQENTFTLEVPFFPGFYESVFESGDMLFYETEMLIQDYQETYGFETTQDDYDFDSENYHQSIATDYIDAFFSRLPKGLVKSMTFESISSPRYYNFSTDKVYATVEMEEGWLDKMMNFVHTHQAWLEKRIKEDWTSYDGFMSFMGNTLEEWKENLPTDERYIATMLAYMMADGNSDTLENLPEELAQETFDMGGYGLASYLTLNPEKERELEEWRARRAKEEEIRQLNDRLQLKMDFAE